MPCAWRGADTALADLRLAAEVGRRHPGLLEQHANDLPWMSVGVSSMLP
jgi:hypothetical protein